MMVTCHDLSRSERTTRNDQTTTLCKWVMSSFSLHFSRLQERRPRICSPHRSNRASWAGGIRRHFVGWARGRLPTLQGDHACLTSLGAGHPSMDGRRELHLEEQEALEYLLATTGPAQAWILGHWSCAAHLTSIPQVLTSTVSQCMVTRISWFISQTSSPKHLQLPSIGRTTCQAATRTRRPRRPSWDGWSRGMGCWAAKIKLLVP